jgi:anti-sigma28 factor (negative regulator of flagellin synthesis)
MKIDDRISNYMALLNTDGDAIKPAAQPGGDHASPAVAKNQSIEVDLSSTSVQLADDEARRERLNIIRQQLAEGSYNISGKDVADKILNLLKG